MKIREFKNYLQKNKISLAFLNHDDPNLAYFTQIKPSFAFFLITPKLATLYLTKLDKFPKIKGVSVKNFPKDWKKKFSKKNVSKIGVNKESLTISYKEKLKKIFPKAKFVDISPKLKELRLQKTPLEISYLSKACQITSLAYLSLLQELQKNTLKTEQDVAFYLERFFQKKGGEVAFPTIVAMGKNAAIPHHVTSNTKLKKGFLLIDFGAKYKNYCADMSRVIYLGTPSKKEENMYDLLLKSQLAAIKAIEENKSYSELDNLVRTKLGNYDKNFVHSLGHGIGLEVHENPVFSNKKHKVLQNVPFTIEPGLYFPGKYGLRIEDTILYNGKIKILTKASKKLISLKIY